eukprot:1307135-Pyramimonas_sp.AAC.1
MEEFLAALRKRSREAPQSPRRSSRELPWACQDGFLVCVLFALRVVDATKWTTTGPERLFQYFPVERAPEASRSSRTPSPH